MTWSGRIEKAALVAAFVFLGMTVMPFLLKLCVLALLLSQCGG